MTEERPTAREGEEIWELTVPGRVWVTTVNARGLQKPTSVGGRQGAKLRIATLDREITQENILDAKDDPFLNGTLVRIDADQNETESTATDQALSTEDLLLVFAKEGGAFQKAVDGLSEVNVRRLAGLTTDVDASLSQSEYLKDSIARRFPVTSGDTPTYRELRNANQVAGNN